MKFSTKYRMSSLSDAEPQTRFCESAQLDLLRFIDKLNRISLSGVYPSTSFHVEGSLGLCRSGRACDASFVSSPASRVF